MCGRINVIDDPLCQWIGEQLGLDFHTSSNHDLRPSQTIATISLKLHSMTQHNATWGIQPSWAKRLLINAKAETVRDKKTFAHAFISSRALVPCNGWYEWRIENGEKRKYLFSHSESMPLLMGAILFPSGQDQFSVVTLTTAANDICAPFHHRMPLLIAPADIEYWFNASNAEIEPLLSRRETPIQVQSS